MSRDSSIQLSPPLEADRNTLADYTSVLQRLLEDIFDDLHKHSSFTTAPTSEDGADRDIRLVELNGTGYIYVKFPTLGWKRIALS
jgi:hypothetical protein